MNTIETWRGRPLAELSKPELIGLIHLLGGQLEEFYDPEEIQFRAEEQARHFIAGGVNGG